MGIKKIGRIVLNRAAASFFEDRGADNVILLWDDETGILTIQAVNSHPEAHPVYYRRHQTPAMFCARASLGSIGYDFSDSRTLDATLVPDQGSIEVRLLPECFLPRTRSESGTHGSTDGRGR